MLESKIQSKVKRNLERNGWHVVKLIQLSENGWPDLMAQRNGVTIYVECKREGEQPKALQQLRHKQLKERGFEVFVTDDPKFTVL